MQLPNPTLFLKPNASRTRTGIVTPALSGAAQTVIDGPSGPSWLIAEQGINFLRNPSAEGDAIGWSQCGGGETITRVQDRAVSGLWALKTVTVGASNWQGVNYLSLDNLGYTGGAITYIGSFWASGVGELDRIHVRVDYTDGTNVTSAYSSMTLGPSMERHVTNTVTITPEKTVKQIGLWIQRATAYGAPMTIYTDAAMVEANPYASDYFDGDMGVGYTWEGTPYASRSIRASGRVTTSIPAVVSPAVGSVLVRWRLASRGWQAGPYGHALHIGQNTSTNTHYGIRQTLTSTYFRDSASSSAINLGTTPQPGISIVSYMGWDATTEYVDGGLGEGVETKARTAAAQTWGGGVIDVGSLGTSYRLNGYVDAVVFFDRVLTAEEVEAARVFTREWTWDTLTVASDPASPAFTSRVFLMQPHVYASTRDNVLGDEITSRVIDLSVDSDIDRQGPKAQCRVVGLDATVIAATQWVAPFLSVTHEDGTVESSQMGLYRLEQPSVTYDIAGTEMLSAIGHDPVIVTQNASVNMPQVTPVGALIGPEIEFAIEQSTVGTLGPELCVNGDFELWGGTTFPTDWSGGAYSGAIGASRSRVTTPVATGESAISVGLDGTSPVGAGSYVWVVPTAAIDARQTMFLLEGFVAAGSTMVEGYIGVEMWAGSTNAASAATNVVTFATSGNAYSQWERAWVYFTPPDHITHLRVTLHTRMVTPGAAGFKAMFFDKVSLRTVSAPPFTRHALPSIPRVASTVIAHNPGASWLQRINDLLAAVGHHAAYALPDGRLTTRPIRDAQTDTPRRIFQTDSDARIVGDITIERATGGNYNRVTAIKEDYQTGSAIVAQAVNDHPDHPWSIPNVGERAAPVVTSNDAVDADALMALAVAKLAQSSEQESLAIAILPDPTLAVHDVIAIDAPTRAGGKWAIENIAWGMTAANPLVTIGARRTFTIAHPEGS